MAETSNTVDEQYAQVFHVSAQQLFESLAASNPGVFFFAADMRKDMAVWSRTAVEYLGLRSSVLSPAGAVWRTLIHADDLQVFDRSMDDMAAHVTCLHNCEYRMKNAKGEYVWVNCRGHMSYEEDGSPSFFAGFVTLMGRRSKIDAATDLWTIYEFQIDMQQKLEAGKSGIVMLISIDHFRTVNDQFGYQFGDKVLHHIGQLLLALRGKSTTVYRMDGADFGVILEEAQKEDAERFEKRLSGLLGDFEQDGIALPLTCTTVATCYPKDGTIADQIHNNLYYALLQAKQDQVDGVVFYNREIYMKITYRARLQSALHTSVSKKCRGFSLVYQPIVDAQTGECLFAEALLRWKNDDYPKIMPSEFIPILEETGFILPVGRYVITTALTTLAAWKRQPGGKRLRNINVNISLKQLQDPSTLGFILFEMDELMLPHDSLVLELTESCHGCKGLAKILEGYRSNGIRIALGNFGTGFETLADLGNMPADVIKIYRTMAESVEESRVQQPAFPDDHRILQPRGHFDLCGRRRKQRNARQYPQGRCRLCAGLLF
jgi:diguanylate cyclase (GGDEF)-like protein